MNKIILHLEGFAVLVLSIYFYKYNQFSWSFFFMLLFVPDISLFGYFINNKKGAIIYNLGHNYIFATITIILGLKLSNQTALAIGLIWSAHIGMDRMLGYGLKYPTRFKDTHLSRV